MTKPIESGEQLIDNLRTHIDYASDKAWAYAQLAGWSRAYPLLSQEMQQPLTREDIVKTYETVTRQMYRVMIEHLNSEDPLPPKDKMVILWCNYADFTGAVLVHPDRNPSFKFGILW